MIARALAIVLTILWTSRLICPTIQVGAECHRPVIMADFGQFVIVQG
jgi:hypothetical protein